MDKDDAKTKDKDSITVKTGNGRIQTLESLMKYAKGEFYIDRYPAAGLRKKDKEKSFF